MVVAAPALFEEGNRTRAFLVRILRLLGERGIASVLPDLPGQGESITSIADVTLMNWWEAFESAWNSVAALAEVAGTVSIRGGALTDILALAPCRWQLAPLTGEELVRDLWRIRQAGDGRTPKAYDPFLFIGETDVQVAGNRIGSDLLTGLHCAEPFTEAEGVPIRVVRLEMDPRPADLKLPGRPLWRASEPDIDGPLAAALAADIADWVYECAA